MIGTPNTQMDDLLTHDHSEIDTMVDNVVGMFSSGEPGPIYQAIDLIWARLAIHIRAEHLHLFPTLTDASRFLNATEAHSIENRIEELRKDHNFFMREMIGTIKTMRQIVANPDSSELSRLGDVKQRIGGLRRRLIMHNGKEESEIYPLADRLLSPEAAAMLRTKMRSELDNLPPRLVGTPLERFNDQSCR
ncbi:MAG: hemerythrin domain-containing protein [Pyrinomonadaceae bacterium]